MTIANVLAAVAYSNYSTTYDQSTTALGAGVLAVYSIIVSIVAIFSLVCLWKIFDKAGEPGWACIIPLYNAYVLYKIAFGNGWLFLLSLVPLVNVVVCVILYFKLSSAFGHGVGFGFGLLFFNPIFMAILAFGSSDYVGA